jgi:hypothetical protein
MINKDTVVVTDGIIRVTSSGTTDVLQNSNISLKRSGVVTGISAESKEMESDPQNAYFFKAYNHYNNADFLISWHNTSTDRPVDEQHDTNNAIRNYENTRAKYTRKDGATELTNNDKPNKAYRKLMQSAFSAISKMTQEEYTEALQNAKQYLTNYSPEDTDVHQPNRFPEKLEDYKRDFIKQSIGNGINLDMEAASKKAVVKSSLSTLLSKTISDLKKDPKQALHALGNEIGKGFKSFVDR